MSAKRRKRRDAIDEMSGAEKAALMDLLWDSLSDAQQAAWLASHHLEYGSPER